jgi:hypothetical protein
MKVRTDVKAGRLSANHNEIMVRDRAAGRGLKIKTNVKAGGQNLNHNETLVRNVA